MSSKKWVWIVVAVVVVGGLVWWSGILGGSNASQPAAVVTTTTQPNPQNAPILGGVAAIDTQMALTQADVKVLGTAPTKAQVTTAAADMQKTGGMITALLPLIQSRLTNLKTAGISVTAAQAALNDLGTQLSNMTSQAGSASKNAMATSSTSVTYTQSAKQIVAAWQFLVNARADIAAVLKNIGN